MTIEIVDFPINSMVIFQFAMLNYQRVGSPYVALKLVIAQQLPLGVQLSQGLRWRTGWVISRIWLVLSSHTRPFHFS